MINHEDLIRKEKLQAEKAYNAQIDFINDIGGENLLAKGRYNLTLNKIEYYFVNSEQGALYVAGTPYESWLNNLCEMAIDDEKKEQLARMLRRESIMSSFYMGKSEFEIEYRRQKDNLDPIWVKTLCRTFRQPNSGNIVAFFYSYDITDVVIEEKIMAKITDIDYDFIGVIDRSKEEFYLKSQQVASSIPDTYKNCKYDSIRLAGIENWVMEDEQAYVMVKSSPKTILNMLENNESYFYTYKCRRNGPEIYHKKMLYTFLDEEKNLILVLQSDITKMYEAEQEQLAKVQKALAIAEKANKAKSQFLSRVSHDLRTPMNGILGFADLALLSDNLEECKEYIKQLKKSGEDLLALINDTLDISTMENEKMEINKVTIRGEQLYRSIVDPLKKEAEKKGLTFKTMLPEKDILLKCDESHIRQIMTNLIGNAIKFTDKGGEIDFSIEITYEDEYKIKTLTTVRDNGIGMSKAFMERMYEPFEQVKAGGYGLYNGSGLGLTIVKRLVDLLHGKIEVTSFLGEGTDVRVYLDIEKEISRKENHFVATGEERKCLKGRRILVCEDHPLNLVIIKKILEKVDCHVVSASNGEEGVETFKEFGEFYFDAILMDIRMPIMDGILASKKIRGLNRADSRMIPIIAVTANAYEEEGEGMRNAGINAHISKPISKEILYKVLTDEIKKKSS